MREEIIENIKNSRAALGREIDKAKDNPAYKLYPEKMELIGCAEMIVFMNDDDFISSHTDKELKKLEDMLKQATALLVDLKVAV